MLDFNDSDGKLQETPGFGDARRMRGHREVRIDSKGKRKEGKVLRKREKARRNLAMAVLTSSLCLLATDTQTPVTDLP